jgi:predicted permease
MQFRSGRLAGKSRCGAPDACNNGRDLCSPCLAEPRDVRFRRAIQPACPFFGLIGLCYLCGKLAKRPEAGLAWMQFFLIHVALPCLFYRLIADKPLDHLTNGPFIAATRVCTFCAFAFSFTVGVWHTDGDMPQSVMQGVAGAYSNICRFSEPAPLWAESNSG